MKADGFDEAIIGVGSRCGSEDVLIYDYSKCVSILVKRDGMSLDEAVDYMEFNVVGAYVGETTPVFMTEYEKSYDKT
tara:strand:- start:184 stop:414 length:231 start_codon:yes stop_codon:yes gene_type:complete